MAAATRDSGSKRPPRALNGSRVITPEIVVMIDKKAELAWLASLEQPPDFPDLIPMIDCGVSSMRAYPVHAMTPTGASSAQEATLQAASPVWDRLSKRRQSTGNTPSHHNGWLDRLDELSSMLKDVSAQHPGPLRRQHLESCVIVEPSSSATTDAPTTYEGVQDQRKGLYTTNLPSIHGNKGFKGLQAHRRWTDGGSVAGGVPSEGNTFEVRRQSHTTPAKFVRKHLPPAKDTRLDFRPHARHTTENELLDRAAELNDFPAKRIQLQRRVRRQFEQRTKLSELDAVENNILLAKMFTPAHNRTMQATNAKKRDDRLQRAKERSIQEKERQNLRARVVSTQRRQSIASAAEDRGWKASVLGTWAAACVNADTLGRILGHIRLHLLEARNSTKARLAASTVQIWWRSTYQRRVKAATFIQAKWRSWQARAVYRKHRALVMWLQRRTRDRVLPAIRARREAAQRRNERGRQSKELRQENKPSDPGLRDCPDHQSSLNRKQVLLPPSQGSGSSPVRGRVQSLVDRQLSLPTDPGGSHVESETSMAVQGSRRGVCSERRLRVRASSVNRKICGRASPTPPTINSRSSSSDTSAGLRNTAWSRPDKLVSSAWK